MVLHVHSNASYLTEPGACSRSRGRFFFSNLPISYSRIPLLNGPILTLAKIIQAVMSSAAEAESGATFLNCKEAVPICTTCKELGHPQPPAPVQVNNTTVLPIAPYARSVPAQWICDSTGSKIEWTNSTFTGPLLTLTWLITTQSITQSSITSGYAQ
jgi:hypothetical protein